MNKPNQISDRIPGLAYTFTENGIELPVLDITHPQFIASIDEGRLADMSKESAKKVKALSEMSDDQKKTHREQMLRSFIFGRLFMKHPDDNFLNGMSTYIYKLGPHLIGGGEDREMDRRISMGIGGVAIRMRIRDLCRLQTDALIPRLKLFPRKDLCFISIAGGAASDSINTLILILQENPTLLENRKIEINVLDIDTLSPHFARRCLEVFKMKTHPFSNLDIAFNHLGNDWKNTDGLIQLLSNRKECIVMCTSEGGLFEYGADEDILRNLKALYDHSPDDTRVAGTFIHDLEKVDPTVPAMTIAAHSGLRFLGLHGLSSLLEKTGWTLETRQVKNPIYGIFTLRKNKAHAT